MPTSRQDHACGLNTDTDDGPKIVVSGGLDSSLVYLDTVDIYTVNTDSWREGNVNQNKDEIKAYLTCLHYSQSSAKTNLGCCHCTF